jgi:hypothetical protein
VSEAKAAYVVKEPNPAGIPARWLNFLQRCARLEGGRTYNFVLIVPADDSDPIWSLLADGKLENGMDKRKPRFLGESE